MSSSIWFDTTLARETVAAKLPRHVSFSKSARGVMAQVPCVPGSDRSESKVLMFSAENSLM